MSARSEAAERIVGFVHENGLDRVFGGDMGYGAGKKYRSILFDRPRTLDGSVRVYSPKFILVRSAGPLGDGQHAFESVENTLAYMKARFVDFDNKAADAVPRKERK